MENWTWIDAAKSLSLIAGFPYRVWKVVPPGWTIHIEVCFYAAIAIGYAICDRLSWRSTAVRWYCLTWLAIYLAISCAMNTRFENATGFIPFFVLGVAIHRSTFGFSGRSELVLLALAFAFSMNAILHWNNVENLSIFTPWSDIEPWFPAVAYRGILLPFRPCSRFLWCWCMLTFQSDGGAPIACSAISPIRCMPPTSGMRDHRSLDAKPVGVCHRCGAASCRAINSLPCKSIHRTAALSDPRCIPRSDGSTLAIFSLPHWRRLGIVSFFVHCMRATWKKPSGRIRFRHPKLRISCPMPDDHVRRDRRPTG